MNKTETLLPVYYMFLLLLFLLRDLYWLYLDIVLEKVSHYSEILFS